MGIIIKKKITYFCKTKNSPIAKRMRKCAVRLSKYTVLHLISLPPLFLLSLLGPPLKTNRAFEEVM